jgi:hypothetical protein
MESSSNNNNNNNCTNTNFQLPLDSLSAIVNVDLLGLFNQIDATIQWPEAKKNKDVTKGDFSAVFGALCGKMKVDVTAYTKDVVEQLNQLLVEIFLDPSYESTLLLGQKSKLFNQKGFCNWRISQYMACTGFCF